MVNYLAQPSRDVLKNWKSLSAKRFPIRDKGNNELLGRFILEIMRQRQAKKMPVCIDSMYVFSKEFLFCLQLERLFFFHIMLLSPLPALPANTSHGSSALSLPLDCSTLLLSSLACSLSSFASCFFSVVYFNFRHSPRCIHTSPSFLRSIPCWHWLPRGTVATAGIKAFQLHLQSQKKNKPVGVLFREKKVNWGQFLVLVSCNTATAPPLCAHKVLFIHLKISPWDHPLPNLLYSSIHGPFALKMA